MVKPSVISVAERKVFQRFSLQFRIQHIVLFVTVILLVFTGIPLWCLGKPGLGWSQSVVAAFGNIETVRYIHRVAAIGLILVSVYHILYTIYSREGRREFIALFPMPKDVVDVTHNSLYFLGLRKERPKFPRFAYLEKFDYWAVYWGCVIMIGSGLLLWFPEIAAQYIPWLPYELAAEIHADEAILAALALFIWHFYNVHFNPSKFPGSLMWLHGKISREEMMHEHPLEYEKLLEEEKSQNKR